MKLTTKNIAWVKVWERDGKPYRVFVNMFGGADYREYRLDALDELPATVQRYIRTHTRTTWDCTSWNTYIYIYE